MMHEACHSRLMHHSKLVNWRSRGKDPFFFRLDTYLSPIADGSLFPCEIRHRARIRICRSACLLHRRLTSIRSLTKPCKTFHHTFERKARRSRQVRVLSLPLHHRMWRSHLPWMCTIRKHSPRSSDRNLVQCLRVMCNQVSAPSVIHTCSCDKAVATKQLRQSSCDKAASQSSPQEK